MQQGASGTAAPLAYISYACVYRVFGLALLSVPCCQEEVQYDLPKEERKVSGMCAYLQNVPAIYVHLYKSFSSLHYTIRLWLFLINYLCLVFRVHLWTMESTTPKTARTITSQSLLMGKFLIPVHLEWVNMDSIHGTFLKRPSSPFIYVVVAECLHLQMVVHSESSSSFVSSLQLSSGGLAERTDKGGIYPSRQGRCAKHE